MGVRTPPKGRGWWSGAPHLYRAQSARRKFLDFFPYISLEQKFHIDHRLGGGGPRPPCLLVRGTPPPTSTCATARSSNPKPWGTRRAKQWYGSGYKPKLTSKANIEGGQLCKLTAEAKRPGGLYILTFHESGKKNNNGDTKKKGEGKPFNVIPR